MQTKIGNKVELGKTVSLFDSIRASSAIDKTVSNYTDAGDQVKKKLESSSKQVPMMLTLRDIYQEPTFSFFKACLKISVQKNNPRTLCTETWRTLTFEFY